MKKSLHLFSFLMVLLGMISTASAQDVLQKAWSRLTVDETNISVIPQNYKWEMPAQVNKTYNLSDGIATVFPSFRPFPSTGTQSELSIDIHPTNENILFFSSNATGLPASNIYGTGVYWTTNGGTSFVGYDDPPFGRNSGDPASVISRSGNFYEGYIDGGTNDGGNGIAVSTNNGTSWTKYVVGTIPSSSDLLDKNHLMVDKKQGSPYEGRVYAAWTEFVSTSANNNKIVVKYSTNNGQTWSSAKNVSAGVNAGSHDQGVNIQTGPNGEVYAFWAVYDNWGAGVYGEDGIGYNVSTDGGETWGVAKRIYNVANFGIRNSSLSPKGIRVSSFPSAAVNLTNGYMYVIWPQVTVAPAGSDPDIVMIRSTNGGTTWSTPARVNDDALNNGKDQYYPWMTIDQTTGQVYAVWYDSRNTANDSAEVYIARSIDHGVTFQNIKVSDHKFKPKTISGLASGYQGDYIGIAALKNIVYPYWADDFTGQYQGWMAKCTFGPNIMHTPLPNTENLSGPYTVTANIESGVPLAAGKVKLFWTRGATFTDSVVMTNSSGNTWTANIPGNGSQATYKYYIVAEDNLGGISYLPSGAPANSFSFEAKTDLVAPVITHTVIGNQYRETWPKPVVAEVTDNIGLDSVYVSYKVKYNGTLRHLKLVKTTGNTYSALFNIDTTLIALNDTLYYRIIARDASAAHNLGYHPTSSTWNSFKFVPDTEFPVVSHTQLPDYAKIMWPAKVRANVTDNLGVKSVKVEFKKNNGSLSTFTLTNLSGSTYEAAFPIDTNQIAIGDSIFYRVIAVDNTTSLNTTYLPVTGYFKFKIVSTKGVVLVVNDEATLSDRVSKDKNGEVDMDSPLGASATLFTTTLQNDGYVVNQVNFSALDTTILDNQSFVILTAGTKTSTIFENAAIRTALVNYTLRGGKVWVEGGEVGYYYRQTTSEKDINFRRNILHDSSWVTDGTTTTILLKKLTGHVMFNDPNTVPDSLAFTGTGYGIRDAMRTIPGEAGVLKVGVYSGYADSASILVYHVGTDQSKVRNVFMLFSISSMVNQVAAANLIKNTANMLILAGQVPVEMTTFTAEAEGNSVNLRWSTATEVNNSGFAVERRSSEGTYTQVAWVVGNGTTSEKSNYSYTDFNLNSGSYTYRLKQVDFDGTVSYSSAVNVEVGPVTVYSLENNYPNPFNPSTLIKFNVPVDGNVSLAVYNLLGEKVAQLVNQNMKAGRHEVTFNAIDLASGIYFYKLEAGNFVSVKKMMLIK